MPYLSQSDERWGDEEYDHAVSNTSISRWGCALTSANMLLQYHGVSNVLPNDLNNWLKEQDDGFTRSDGVIWNTIGRYPRSQDLESSTLEFEYPDIEAIKENVKTELNNGNPPILKVNKKFGCYHFLVATGVNSDDKILVNDPGSPTNLTLEDAESYWGSLFQIGRYTLSNTDLSYVIGYVDDGFDIDLIKDEVTVSSSFGENPILNIKDPEELSVPALNALYYPKPNSEEYKMKLSGNSGVYLLDTYLYDISGYSNMNSFYGLISDSEDSDEYIITFDKTDNSISTIDQPSTTFDSILNDIQTSFEHGAIHNRGLYRSTYQLLLNSKKLTERNLVLPAEILLNIVLDRLKSETSENINEEYSNYLIQEIEALLANL